MVGVTEGREVQPGRGEEAAEEPGPVLHPAQPGLDQHGELGEVALGEVGQGSLSRDQTSPTGFSSCAYDGSWTTVSQSRAATSSAIAALTWQFRLSHTTTSGPVSC